LSQLEGMTVEFYKEVALPKLLDHVLSVKDTMSQQYLFESMIQVFPDEFHIATLEQELACYTKAQPSVDMKPVMKALMDRLSAFLSEHKDEDHALAGVDIFALFNMHLKAILERTLEPAASGAPAGPDPLVPVIELQATFMQFTLNLFAEVHHVDIIMQSTSDLIMTHMERQGQRGGKLNAAAADKVVELLSHVLKTMPRECLEMDNCVRLLGCLNHNTRKQVALNMVTSVLEGSSMTIDRIATQQKLFEFISPLIKNEDDATDMDSRQEHFNEETFKAEQQKVAKLVYRIEPYMDEETEQASLDIQMEILVKMRAGFGQGTERRLVHTLPPLIYYAMGMVEKKKQETEENQSKLTLKKIFQFIHKTITALNEHAPLVSIQLWLTGALVSDKIAAEAGGDSTFAPISAEFISQAWEVFEDKASDSVDIRACLLQFIGTFGQLQCYDQESFTNGAQTCVKNAKKMIKKHMKIEMMIASSHLFGGASEQYQDVPTCLTCCQTVLKQVDAQVQGDAKQVGLWVDMLNVYIYYYSRFPSVFVAKNISQIQALCAEHTDFAKQDDDAREDAEKALVHLAHTERYLKALKTEKPESFADFEVH